MSEYDTCTTQKALSVLHINGQIIKLLLCRLLDPQQTHIHMNALTFQFLCKQRTHADNFQVWPTSLSDTVAHSHQAITTQEPRLCLTSQIHSKWTQVRMTGSATVFLARMLLLERDCVHPYLLPYKFSSDFVWKRIHLHFFSHGLTSHPKKNFQHFILYNWPPPTTHAERTTFHQVLLTSQNTTDALFVP